MKKSIGIITSSFFLIGFLFTSCSSPSEKVESAEDNLTEAQQELNESKEDYKKEIEEYKMRSADQIAANEKSIQEFNARIADQKSEARADYKKEIAELESKNSDMKKKMEDFKADSQSSWESFKTEFGRDMTELGDAFRDFSNDNKK
tara:strand:- start:16707 stop:17147 length:441 start_codon:yes stop_codon:yes gene_type:complete